MTKKSDDLTIIRGIGEATAKKLAAAGISTFALLAAVTDPLPPALDKLGSADEWKWWRKAAQREVDRIAKVSGGASAAAAADAPTEAAPATERIETAAAPAPSAGGAGTDPAATAAPASAGADAKPAAEASAVGSSWPLVRITSKREGFRRAGIAHTRDPVDHPAHLIAQEQLTALCAEPMLTVALVFENGQVHRLTQWPPSEEEAKALRAAAEMEPA